MTKQGFNRSQGQKYAQAMMFARQLDIARLRLLSSAIERLIIERKTL